MMIFLLQTLVFIQEVYFSIQSTFFFSKTLYCVNEMYAMYSSY